MNVFLYEPDENRVLEGVMVVLRHLFVFCYLPPGVMHHLFKRRRSDGWTRQSSFRERKKVNEDGYYILDEVNLLIDLCV